jgi:hypothetical protein
MAGRNAIENEPFGGLWNSGDLTQVIMTCGWSFLPIRKKNYLNAPSTI